MVYSRNSYARANDDSRFDLNWHNEEITINTERKQDFEYYHSRLHVAFREIYRVLKPKRYMTVTFHNTSMKVYNSILRAVMFAGFDLERIIYQPPARARAPPADIFDKNEQL